MPTTITSAAPSVTDPRTPMPIDWWRIADEPSHIHIPRPSRVMRPAAEAAPLERSEPRGSARAGEIAEA